MTVGVRSGGSGKVREETMTRAEVALPNVSSNVREVDGRKLGYVRLLSFSVGAHALLADAVRKVQRQGAEGLVLDLRGNPGGLLDEAVAARQRLPPGGRGGGLDRVPHPGRQRPQDLGGNLPALPMVVLIDRGTASAAEILTAALADNGDATVVGTRSFGKGVFQEERDLANGGALKLTVGEYFTPDGTNLAESKGIHPEIKASDNLRTRPDEALQRALGVLAGQVGG